jgi:hypothetical protein
MNDPVRDTVAEEPGPTTSHEAQAGWSGPAGEKALTGWSEAQMFEDWSWIYEQIAAGALIQYHEQHIAVSGKKILGVGTNSFELERRVCERYGLPREATFIKYVEFGM